MDRRIGGFGRWLLVIPLTAGLSSGAARAPENPFKDIQDSQPASQPATQPRGPTPFQPGIAIDWAERAVRVEAHVVLREGPLEFFACFGGKEHESVLRIDAAAVHLYMALGLLGLTPGHPPQWDEAKSIFEAPTGDPIDVQVEWTEGGQPRVAEAFAWLRAVESDRPPLPRPWLFAGSQSLPDKTLLADRTGAGLALVDFSDSLLALSRGHVSRDADLWVMANTPAIPPRQTKVQLVLRPARPRTYQVALDFRGAIFVDGRYAVVEDLVDLILLARRTNPAYVQTIATGRALRGDVARLERRLLGLGLSVETFRLVESP